MPEEFVQQTQAETPQVATPKTSGFDWKKVLVVVVIGAILLAIVWAAYYFLYQNQSSETTGKVEIKQTTSSAKPATSSAGTATSSAK